MLQLKQALWAGGISRSNKNAAKSSTPGLKDWSDLVSGWGCVHVFVFVCVGVRTEGAGLHAHVWLLCC